MVILIDSMTNAKILARVLIKYGVNVTISENGLVGINAVQESMEDPYDIILMDNFMPVMVRFVIIIDETVVH